MAQDLTRAGIVAIFGMVIGLLPLAVGAAYLWRPNERLLAAMRPLSLATIFAALNTLLSGVAAVLRHYPTAAEVLAGYDMHRVTRGLSESVTPMFIAFGFLTVAWLCVAVGLRRQP